MLHRYLFNVNGNFSGANKKMRTVIFSTLKTILLLTAALFVSAGSAHACSLQTLEKNPRNWIDVSDRAAFYSELFAEITDLENSSELNSKDLSKVKRISSRLKRLVINSNYVMGTKIGYTYGDAIIEIDDLSKAIVALTDVIGSVRAIRHHQSLETFEDKLHPILCSELANRLASLQSELLVGLLRAHIHPTSTDIWNSRFDY